MGVGVLGGVHNGDAGIAGDDRDVNSEPWSSLGFLSNRTSSSP